MDDHHQDAVSVTTHDHQDDDDPHRVDAPDRWGALAQAALITEGVTTGELTVTFVDAGAMTELNVAHMDGDGPTDVLAFPIDGQDAALVGGGSTDGMPVLLGDVVICPAVARANAETHGRNVDDELALLVVHGVLHVLGHDHQGVDDTARMRSREEALLAAHHR